MTIDPYSSCPCGSGKKFKWCCQAYWPKIEKIHQLLESKQEEAALRAVDKLQQEIETAADPKASSTLPFVKTLRVQTFLALGDEDRVDEELDRVIEQHPDYALTREMKAEIHFIDFDFENALEGFRAALANLPAEAVDEKKRVYYRLGLCHLSLMQPLAAWADWSQALKLDSKFSPVLEAMEQFIQQDPLLPNAARRGLALKAPDELSVFNEERRAKWESATKSFTGAHLNDVVDAFEYLAKDDPSDLAAWYNLGVTAAWTGDNVRAIEALEHYADREPDASASAEAFDLCELLRFGSDACEHFGVKIHTVLYQCLDGREFLQRLQTRQVLVTTRKAPPDSDRGDKTVLLWLNRERPAKEDRGLIVGAPLRVVARIELTPNAATLAMAADTMEDLAEARESFEKLMGDVVTVIVQDSTPGTPRDLDFEAIVPLENDGPVTLETSQEAARRYFEEVWLHRPVASLGGLTPSVAAGDHRRQRRLEGILRFRERSFGQYGVPYDFDRLRQRLNLP
ncbi:MAG: hypothetical protein ACRDD1_11465, partial [Planctomycetia bacterium]